MEPSWPRGELVMPVYHDTAVFNCNFVLGLEIGGQCPLNCEVGGAELESWVKSAISIHAANWSRADGDVAGDSRSKDTSLCRSSWKQWDYLGRLLRYFINSTNDRERSDNSWWPTDCTAIYFLPWARQWYSVSTVFARQLQKVARYDVFLYTDASALFR